MTKILLIITFFIIGLFILPISTNAHCDTLDGPVITAARKALDHKNPNFVLIWVKKEDEEEVKKAFKKALDKRKRAKNQQEKIMAEMEFFESLVKIHRLSEGANYEGLKPIGQIPEEIKLADQAVESGQLDKVLARISSSKDKNTIQQLFQELMKDQKYSTHDLDKGRQFVKSYVNFLHSAEKFLKV